LKRRIRNNPVIILDKRFHYNNNLNRFSYEYYLFFVMFFAKNTDILL